MAPSEPKSDPSGLIADLDRRSRDVFRQIVDNYLTTGEPVGSRTLSQLLAGQSGGSPATIRNVMADLESAGLLYSPHTSAGRVPTHQGLRLFVDAMMEVGDLQDAERARLEAQIAGANQGQSMAEVLSEATGLLSGLSHCAGIVTTGANGDQAEALKHVEFVHIGGPQALVVLVTESGRVENRLIDLPPGTTPSQLQQATNYVNARVASRTLAEARNLLQSEIDQERAALDALTATLVDQGLAVHGGADQDDAGPTLIVRGRSNLLDDVAAVEDLERTRQLLDDLEAKRDLMQLLQDTDAADGVRVFIGAENQLFSLSGSSMIVAPYQNAERQVVGMIGVIGPTRLNYGRIVPMVDFTAQLIGKMVK